MNSRHYLREIKSIIDEVCGEATLHVCIEASHPSTLGRPSDQLVELLMSENFGSTNGMKVHFIPDRLSVPPLEGHILSIGGPRSNVISRIAMEYEVNFLNETPFYRRYTGARFDLDYIHTTRRDYEGRLLSDVSTLDDTAIWSASRKVVRLMC
ncbi:hypothetical protein [Parvularcula bermudensis]|uniref:hypothetical protein n=1 Tax=Parvularcula bermudensis TaxID=208216 RepID=UPI0011D281C2|nr:hypothetical protein [Parvularcula bermudensis]